jgi:transcriptional regulator of acetoin/glycerol metabolism
MCDGGLITREHLPTAVTRPAASVADGAVRSLQIVPSPVSADSMNLEGVERDLVEKALDQAKGNKSRAARLLGLTRAQLYSRIEKYGVQ